ncbi:MAG: sigma-70 family RNA polymerase sigma factor [Thermomicrobiales bacterium]|nr:sigma-70 family RNA polymerase sigma factor [Thermomicrobiales bacterium]
MLTLLPPIQPTDALEPPGAETSDSVLVARAQADPRAFGALYGRYVDRVYQYCFRRLGTRESAEDATSQVFLQALAALPRYRGDRGSFRSWLFTIAHNIVVDHYRAARPGHDQDELELLPDHRPSPEDLAEMADRGRALREALVVLPARQRQVIELRLAGLTSMEIGVVMGCKARSVDVAQYRAVEKLRLLMGVQEQRDADD